MSKAIVDPKLSNNVRAKRKKIPLTILVVILTPIFCWFVFGGGVGAIKRLTGLRLDDQDASGMGMTDEQYKKYVTPEKYQEWINRYPNTGKTKSTDGE